MCIRDRLIPCLNEEQTIGKVVADFRRELPDAVIYVYDNASDDRTSQVEMCIRDSVWPDRHVVAWFFQLELCAGFVSAGIQDS